MSTNYHTPIEIGASNDPATVNTPLGRLDQAIRNEYARAVAAEANLSSDIAAVIINDGTANAEVSQARGGETVLDGRLDAIERNIFNVERQPYGASEAGTAADNTTAINAAIAAAAAVGGVVQFPPGRAYSVNQITIGDRCILQGNGSRLNGSSNTIFAVENECDFVIIRDFEANYVGATGTVGKEFFTNIANNGDYDVGASADYGAAFGGTVTHNEIGYLEISGCRLGHAKITVGGETTVAHIMRNKWEHTSSVSSGPYYLHLRLGEASATQTQHSYIIDNTFDVYPPTGTNSDIIKLTSGGRGVVIRGNNLINRNLNSEAQIDVFRGAYAMRFVENVLINVQLHRKIWGSPLVDSVEQGYDYIAGNYFEFEDGHTEDFGMIFTMGTRFSIIGNQFKNANTHAAQRIIHIEESDYDDQAFPVTEGHCFIISNNMADLRGATSASFINYEKSTDDIGGYAVINGNLVMGGGSFFNGSSTHNPKHTAIVGNVWNNAGSNNIEIAPPSVATGNVFGTSAVTLAHLPSYGPMQVGTYTINGALNDIDANGVQIRQIAASNASADSVRGILNGFAGQRLTLVCSTANPVTLLDSSGASPAQSMRLNGSTDYTMVSTDTITLMYVSSGTGWVEVARSDNS